MSLGAVRPRPKANKPSISNQSAMSGGLFGREPTTYGQVIDGGAFSGGGFSGGGDDFMDRLAQAEVRDSHRQRNTAQKKQQAYGRRSQDGGFTDTSWGFGDDSMPSQQNNTYQTSNSATNSQMQQAHEAAIQRHHEQTIRELLLDQGITGQDAEREIEMWRRDVASGKAAPIPIEENVPQVAQRRGARGENGQFLQQAAFEDPFKVRGSRSATPKKPKPWEIDDAFKNRTGNSPPQAKVKPFEVNDPFKQRTATQSNYDSYGMGHAAGGAARTFANPEPRAHQMTRDPNASSVQGGIFG